LGVKAALETEYWFFNIFEFNVFLLKFPILINNFTDLSVKIREKFFPLRMIYCVVLYYSGKVV